MIRILLVSYLLLHAACASVQGDPAAEPERGWPREVTSPKGDKVTAYQPQIDSWEDYSRLRGRMAVAVEPKDGGQTRYGAVYLNASTETDFESRMVTIDEVAVEKIEFPGLEAKDRAKAEAIAKELIGDQPMDVSLDRVLAAVELGAQQQRETKVNLAPPPIHYSADPAILVVFLGEPQFQPVPGTKLLFATNTNWDLFLETGTKRYFLLDGDTWITTTDLEQGSWAPALGLPKDMARLPDDDNWKEVKERVPGQLATTAPKVFVSKRPAELIVTDGPPGLEAIAGTQLMWVTNTDSDLFMHLGDGMYYYLVAGRWFLAPALDGRWSAATRALPKDFAKIPDDHAQADVLASVPGTPAAREAAVQASIPRTATVSRQNTTVAVVYDGDPRFEKIAGTEIAFAVNTAFDVFLLRSSYYLCHKGIWFVAVTPAGPWSVCDSVPKELYAIPADHPKHNVTYVYVYRSTPSAVYVGYTAGYMGCYLAYGALMFGCGYWFAPHGHYYRYPYHGCYFSYGCGAYYSHYHGTFYRANHHYGPHGGAGHGAIYNPATGGWARGGYVYGASGGRLAAQGYNPWTGRYGATVQGSNGYRSWGQSVVATRDGYVHTRRSSGPGGTTRAFETSKGAAGLTRKGRGGSTTRVVKDKDNNLYVGRNGEVYRRDQGGGWQQKNRTGWEQAKRPNPGGIDRDRQARQRAASRERRYQPPANWQSGRPKVTQRQNPQPRQRSAPQRSRSGDRPGRSGRFGGGGHRRGGSFGGGRGGGGARRRR